MKKLLCHTTVVLAVSVFATAISAQSSVDTNGDKLLSYSELLAVYPSITETQFSAMDLNSDGAIDVAEAKTAQEAGLLPAD